MLIGIIGIAGTDSEWVQFIKVFGIVLLIFAAVSQLAVCVKPVKNVIKIGDIGNEKEKL